MMSYLIVCLAIVAATLLLAVNYLYGFHRLSESHLAIASDVIDCKHLNSFQHYLYDTASITETSDTNKMDNPHLQVDVFSVAYSKILYHNYSLNASTGTIVLERGSKSMQSFVPIGGYNRPHYLRKGSNITIEVTLQVNALVGGKVTLYLFNNEDSVKDFISDPDSNPRYSSMRDVTLNNGKYVYFIDASDYYYVIVDLRSENKIQFTYNMTFNVVYVDVDDYPHIHKKRIGSNGSTVHEAIDPHGNSMVFCSIPALPPDSLDSFSTHLQIEYAARAKAVVVVTVILVVEFVLFILIWPLCKLIAFCCRKPRRNGHYESLSMSPPISPST